MGTMLAADGILAPFRVYSGFGISGLWVGLLVTGFWGKRVRAEGLGSRRINTPPLISGGYTFSMED